MKLTFPEGFLWGTATSALQIESAYDHDWKGLVARDGSVLDDTIKHEQHRDEDAKIISSLGNAYRFSLDWSKLQKGPTSGLETSVVDEYRRFIGQLKDKGTHIMLVLHHFANPRWFSELGSWVSEDSIRLFADYAAQITNAFGDLVDSWNTFNEPCVYTSLAYLTGQFPPHKKNPFLAKRVLQNLAKAHNVVYDHIKEKLPSQQVGIAKNTMIFHPENLIGFVPAKISDAVFIDYVSDHFRDVDFFGINYYGKVSFDPWPITEVDNPGKLDKLGRPHDKMWEYHPEGLKQILTRFSKKYGKPIIITENGCCTDDDSQRIAYIRDHIRYAHEAMKSGVDLKGYFYWSAFDNFELHLGRSYRFGLVHVDPATFEREPKNSAAFYADIAKNNSLDFPGK